MPPTIGESVNALTARFAAAGLETPRLDARLLIAHVLDVTPTKLFVNGAEPLPDSKAGILEAIVTRRLAHEPVSRIRGQREFYGLTFDIDPSTLDPRPDTETLVEAALRLRIPERPTRILDLGTGSGCILLALLSVWPETSGVGIDAAADAVAMATRNAARLGLDARATFRQGTWCEGLVETFDVIVSNPPYIPDEDIAHLAPEVAAFDPPLALRGGKDGLEAYRQLGPQLHPRLRPAGHVLLEVGRGQADFVAAILAAHDLPRAAFYNDLGGVARVVAASAAK